MGRVLYAKIKTPQGVIKEYLIKEKIDSKISFDDYVYNHFEDIKKDGCEIIENYSVEKCKNCSGTGYQKRV